MTVLVVILAVTVGGGVLFWGGQVAWLTFCIITIRDYPSGRKPQERKGNDDTVHSCGRR